MASNKNSKLTGSPYAQEDGNEVSESRKRQSKKDEAIRRKIEKDLSKKKRNNAKSTRFKKGTPGSVLALKPSELIICRTTSTVYEAAQLMSTKRENCLLVVNDAGELMGIFTAKDLAFRIVGSGLNANSVTIDQIMTPNPMCANSNTPASEALNLMVHKKFRHLPVLDDLNQIVGILDITKCYSQQMERLERMYLSSKKLYEALDNVHSQIGYTEQSSHIAEYFEHLKDKISGPRLETMLDNSTAPIYATIKTSVYDATVLMKDNNTTAVLVKDTNDEVAGIFTSKDVVLRVIASGLDPKNCSIVRVMTPQPDVANYSVSIQEALRKMFNGHYLNLPVTNDEGEIVGIVDVLKLTYAVLNQIKQLEHSESDNTKNETRATSQGEGPAWNKFWTSLDNEETDSVHSDSFQGSKLHDLNTPDLQTFSTELAPFDSVSHITTPLKSDASFKVSSSDFVFKFKSPGISGRMNRVTFNPEEGIGSLRNLIDAKLHWKDKEALSLNESEGETYAISFVDDEGDVVSITSDVDLIDCVKIYENLKRNKVEIYIHNPNEPAIIPQEKREITKDPRKKNLGIPQEFILPGALTVLATSILIGITLNRK